MSRGGCFEALVIGEDAELIECRRRMPEPTRVGFQDWRVLVDAGVQLLRSGCETGRRIEIFDRVLVITTGATFWAWQSRRDGKIYL